MNKIPENYDYKGKTAYEMVRKFGFNQTIAFLKAKYNMTNEVAFLEKWKDEPKERYIKLRIKDDGSLSIESEGINASSIPKILQESSEEYKKFLEAK